MKIYETQGFPNPARIRIALAELGLTDKVEFIPVDVAKGEHKKPDFVKKNPFPAVPVLELDDGTTLAECTAITEYLDHLGNGPTALTGTTPKQRAVIHMMQRRTEAALLDAVASYFHHATPGLGPDIEEFQSREWGLHQRDRAVKGMRYLNDVLETSQFIAGDEFSMADITAITGLNFADAVKIDIPENLSHLFAWRKLVSSRPSVAA